MIIYVCIIYSNSNIHIICTKSTIDIYPTKMMIASWKGVCSSFLSGHRLRCFLGLVDLLVFAIPLCLCSCSCSCLFVCLLACSLACLFACLLACSLAAAVVVCLFVIWLFGLLAGVVCFGAAVAMGEFSHVVALEVERSIGIQETWEWNS